MNAPTPSSPSRPLFLRARLVPALMLSAGLVLSACHKEEAPKPAPDAAKETPAPAKEQPKVAHAPEAAPAPAPLPEPEPEAGPASASQSMFNDPALLQRVTAFKAFHPFTTATQLFKIPAFTEPLAAVLKDAAKDPQLVDRIMASNKKAAESQPFSGQPKINLKIDRSTPASTDHLLAAVIDGDPSRFVDFVLAGMPNASIEFVVLPAAR